MIRENDESIFELKLESEGAIALNSVNRIAKFFLIIGFVLTVLVMGTNFFRYLYYRKFDPGGDPFLIFELRISPLIGIIMMCLYYYQWSLYVKFARQCSQSVRDRDQHSFNRSFRTMLKGMKVLLWIIIADLVFEVYWLIASVRDYLHTN